MYYNHNNNAIMKQCNNKPFSLKWLYGCMVVYDMRALGQDELIWRGWLALRAHGYI
jgi:hypothetical protein